MSQLSEGIKDIEDMIATNQNLIQEYINVKDQDLVFSLGSVENLVTKQIEIASKITVPDICVNFSFDESDLLKLDQFINTMHQFSFESISAEASSKLVEEFFNIENSWICHTCESQNTSDLAMKKTRGASKEKSIELKCQLWETYKPLDLYPSFFYNKPSVSKEDLDLLK